MFYLSRCLEEYRDEYYEINIVADSCDTKKGRAMELKFDGSQDYQLAAIQAVIDLFEGQSLAQKAILKCLLPERFLLYSTILPLLTLFEETCHVDH